MSQGFEQLGVKSVRAYCYDVNRYVFPDSVDFTMGLPIMYFYPAYNKKAPFTRYNGEGHAGTFLKWVQEHADVQFQFPIDVSRIGSPKTQEDIDNEERHFEHLEQKRLKDEAQQQMQEQVQAQLDEGARTDL